MDKLSIDGGTRLEGEVRISGAKNAALPILCAALLTPEPVTLSNIPRLNDVRTMLALLGQMGVKAERGDGTLALAAATVDWPLAPYEMVKTMRASILALGPLLARCGEARVSLPGGCARSISTSKDCRRSVPRSISTTVTSMPRRDVSSEPRSSSTSLLSRAPRT